MRTGSILTSDKGNKYIGVWWDWDCSWVIQIGFKIEIVEKIIQVQQLQLPKKLKQCAEDT